MRGSGAAVAILLLAACSSVPSPTPSASMRPPVYVQVPTMPPVLPSRWFGCLGVGFVDAILHGDPDAEVKVWIEPISTTASTRIEVIWPNGFVARFTPRLELLDANGTVIAGEGDRLTGLGGVVDSDTRWAITEVNGHSYPPCH